MYAQLYELCIKIFIILIEWVSTKCKNETNTEQLDSDYEILEWKSCHCLVFNDKFSFAQPNYPNKFEKVLLIFRI